MQFAQDGALPVQVEAIASLSNLDLGAATQLALQRLRDARLSETHFDTLAHAFVSRQGGVDQLISQLSRQPIPQQAALDLLNAFNALGSSPPELISLLRQAAELPSRLPEFSAAYVSQVAAQISQGDPHRGEQLFRSRAANCYACHQVGGVGGIVGPELSAVGTTLPIDRLIQEVLWPQRLVKEGYTLRQIITEDGEVVQGYVRKSRDKNIVLLRPIASHNIVAIRKDVIEHQQDTGSAMPDNIVAALSEQQRLDLLRFLSELGRPGAFSVSSDDVIRRWNVKSSDGWRPRYATVSGKLPASRGTIGDASRAASFVLDR